MTNENTNLTILDDIDLRTVSGGIQAVPPHPGHSPRLPKVPQNVQRCIKAGAFSGLVGAGLASETGPGAIASGIGWGAVGCYSALV